MRSFTAVVVLLLYTNTLQIQCLKLSHNCPRGWIQVGEKWANQYGTRSWPAGNSKIIDHTDV